MAPYGLEGGREIDSEPESSPELPTLPGGTIRQMIEVFFGSFENRRRAFPEPRS